MSAIGLGLAMVTLSSTTAQAHTGEPPWSEGGIYCTDPGETYGAWVCFESSGDDIWVKDTAPDGASAVADWYVNYDRDTPDCVNSHGANTWHECTFDMREEGTIYFRARVYDASEGVWVRSGPWYYAPIGG